MKLRSIFLASLAVLGTTSAFAVPAGTWTVGVGGAYVDPDSKESTLTNDLAGAKVSVDSDIKPSVTFEYFPMNNVGVELLAALPFHHKLTVNTGAGEVYGDTDQLPPTVSVNYHFDGLNSAIKPFIGVGVNYTTFFNEHLYDGLGTELKLKDSVGAAGHVGVDFKLNPTDAVRVDARYIDLQTDVKVGGKDVGTVDVNPWVYGVSYVKSF